jgi:hypothetical protein
MQGKVAGIEYSVHWSQGSDDWQIYWKNDELPEMQFMTFEQCLAQLQFLYANKIKIREYLNFQKFINKYGYEGQCHNIQKPADVVDEGLKARLLEAIEKLDPAGYIRVEGRKPKAQ